MSEQPSHFEEEPYDVDALAPEANPYLPMVIDTYTPKEQDRLKTFQHISELIHKERQSLNKGNKPMAWGALGSDGRVAEPWMIFDPKFLHTWSRVLGSMYETEFEGKPHMEMAANTVVAVQRENYEGLGKVMTPGEMEDLMNRE